MGLDLNKVSINHDEFFLGPGEKDIPWESVRALSRKTKFKTADVKRLFRSFRELAGETKEDQTVIERHQFKEALEKVGFEEYNLQNEAFVSRLFKAFDRDGTDRVDFTEFILGLSAISNGTILEKLQFLFSVYDLDGTGSISRDEMVTMLSLLDECAAAVQEEIDEETQQLRKESVKDFVAEVFDSFDAAHNGRLSFEEFYAAVSAHPVLISFTLDEKAGRKAVDVDSLSLSICYEDWVKIGMKNGWLGRQEISKKLMLKKTE